MQTIGETTNKRDFVPSQWTDILFKSLSGKTNNYTIDVKIGTKRIATDNQDAKESPKKRRKQSNPTRISSNEENTSHGFVTESSLSPGVNRNEPDRIESSKSAAPFQHRSPSSSPLNLTKYENEILLSDGKVKCSNNVRGRNESSTDISKDSSSSCPQSTTTVPYFGKKDGYSSESFACVSFTNQQCASTAVAVVPSPTVQIFNPEAFCDQCNKEFCNKYFLKTHKANKHGVFVDNYPNGGSSVQDPLDGSKTMWLPMASDVSARANETSAAVVPSTPSLFKSPVALVPQPPTNTNTYAAKHVQVTAAAAAAAGNQTRAYCSVCQKEFCNKYFVKRHKAKIHGITDDADSRTAVDDVPLDFKTAVKMENEDSDTAAVFADTCDKDETISPADDVRRPTATNIECVATSVIVRAPYGCHARAERPDDDDDENTYDLGNAGTDGANGCLERDDGSSRARERPCHGCRQTCDSDAWLSGAERCEDGANGGGGASTGSGNSAETDGQQSAALSSFCRICNKELCNKYFMKTHMQRMHGISIRHGNHIGGVVCDVCNKELCSKYFLRVHKQNSHGIAAENGVATAACPKPSWPENVQPVADESAPDGGHAYYRRYAEACDICFRRFRSPKWLAAHLLNDHGDEGRALWKRVQLSRRGSPADDACPADDGGERNALKQYRCSYCPFATSVLSFLFVHEKFHLAEDKTAAAAAAAADNRCPPPSPESRRRELADGHSDADRLGSRTVPEPVHEPFIMQSFFLENCSVSPSSAEPESAAGRSDSFHSSLVYLPVKEKLTSTVNVFFKLTPT